jgi:hypothetical protein
MLITLSCINIKINSGLNLGNACCHSVPDLYFSHCNLKITIYLLWWAGHVAFMAKDQHAYRVSLGNPGGKAAFGRPLRTWEDINPLKTKRICFI